MLWIAPSRGRPQNAAALIESWEATRVSAELLIVVDDDDPEVPGYRKILHDAPPWVRWQLTETRGMVNALNKYAVLAADTHDVIGFMGDDHRPRTASWDKVMREWITWPSGKMGICYGNDLLQGANLPTHVLMSSEIIRALTKMAPRELTHLYVDNYWKSLGEAINRLVYLPSIVIEHMHPAAGKAEWDDGYKRVNAGEMYANDAAAFNAYANDGRFARDVEAVKGIL